MLHLDPVVVSAGIIDELKEFEALVRDLDESETKYRTVFWGLPVLDVVAHVAGVITDVTSGAHDGLATPSAVARQIQERAGLTRAELLDELRRGRHLAEQVLAELSPDAWEAPAPGAYDGSLREAVQDLWEDFWLHGDDIRNATARASDRGPGLRASVAHLGRLLHKHGWGPATLQLDDLEPVPLGDPSRSSRVISGDAVTFVRVVTGRAAPISLDLDASIVIAS